MISRTPVALLLLAVAASSIAAQTDEGVDPAVGGAGAQPAGKNWLLLIGINEYKHWPDLVGPRNDVRELKKVLLERYQFEEDHVIELMDEEATYERIYETWGYMKNAIESRDTLLFYYAGHGEYNEFGVSSWITHEGGLARGSGGRLADMMVQGFLQGVRAQHKFLIVDSCFSGGLLNTRGIEPRTAGTGPISERYAREFQLASSTVLTSGNLEEVLDTKYDGHSEFAYYVLRALRNNSQPYLDALDIFDDVRRGVQGQLPGFGELKDTRGQRGGSYVFFLKEAPPLPFVPRDIAGFERSRPPVPSRLPPAPPVDPGPEIREVLTKWAQAYEAEDLRGLRAVWPDTSFNDQTFENTRVDKVEIVPDSVQIEPSGGFAVVDCRIELDLRSRGGPVFFNQDARFELRRQDSGWIVTKYTIAKNTKVGKKARNNR